MIQVVKAMKKVFVLGVFFCLFLLSLFIKNTVSANSGEPQTCVGNYSYTTLSDLVVPEGQTCMIGRFNVVNGDIKVKAGANLIICPDNDIRGDIKANRPNTVFISDQIIGLCALTAPPPKALGITIGGDVKVEGGSNFTLLGNPLGVVAIKGNVKIKNMQTVAISQFTINGDTEVKNNTDLTVTGNIIGGDLKIKGTSGTCIEQNNSVSGKLDSCP